LEATLQSAAREPGQKLFGLWLPSKELAHQEKKAFGLEAEWWRVWSEGSSSLKSRLEGPKSSGRSEVLATGARRRRWKCAEAERSRRRESSSEGEQRREGNGTSDRRRVSRHRWRLGDLEEQKNSKRGATIGEANYRACGQRLRVEQDVGVEVLVRGSLLAGERTDTQRHGRIQSDEG
jgi:hypothetical protein